MTQYFTTPQFADLLKEHGIEIETPFNLFILKGDNDADNYGIGLFDDNTKRYIDIYGYNHTDSDVEQIKPAYLLQQVLGWLPEYVNYDGKKFKIIPTIENKVVSANCFGVDGKKFLHFTMPIEQLFTKLLQDAIINKQTINQLNTKQ